MNVITNDLIPLPILTGMVGPTNKKRLPAPILLTETRPLDFFARKSNTFPLYISPQKLKAASLRFSAQKPPPSLGRHSQENYTPYSPPPISVPEAGPALEIRASAAALRWAMESRSPNQAEASRINYFFGYPC